MTGGVAGKGVFSVKRPKIAKKLQNQPFAGKTFFVYEEGEIVVAVDILGSGEGSPLFSPLGESLFSLLTYLITCLFHYWFKDVYMTDNNTRQFFFMQMFDLLLLAISSNVPYCL